MLSYENSSGSAPTERRNLRMHWGFDLSFGSAETPSSPAGQVRQEEYRSESYPIQSRQLGDS